MILYRKNYHDVPFSLGGQTVTFKSDNCHSVTLTATYWVDRK